MKGPKRMMGAKCGMFETVETYWSIRDSRGDWWGAQWVEFGEREPISVWAPTRVLRHGYVDLEEAQLAHKNLSLNSSVKANQLPLRIVKVTCLRKECNATKVLPVAACSVDAATRAKNESPGALVFWPAITVSEQTQEFVTGIGCWPRPEGFDIDGGSICFVRGKNGELFEVKVTMVVE